jgi:adenylate kinase family enzyme
VSGASAVGQRVAIIGSGGAGKSTLARQLGDITGLPVVHLDAHFWKPGWVSTPNDEWDATVTELAAGERWILDGNYGRTMELRFARADTVVFVDYSRWLCCYRAVKRRVRYAGRSRPDMAEGCEEKIDLEFLKWIWDYPATRRPGILARLNELRDEGKRVVVLRNPRETRRFLRRVALGTHREAQRVV